MTSHKPSMLPPRSSISPSQIYEVAGIDLTKDLDCCETLASQTSPLDAHSVPLLSTLLRGKDTQKLLPQTTGHSIASQHNASDVRRRSGEACAG